MDSPYRLEDFRILEGVPQSIERLKSEGYLVVVVSNQPGVAKGKCDMDYLDRLNRKMGELLGRGAEIDGLYYCLHHPEASVSQFRVLCQCRKPKPGLILEAAASLGIDRDKSFMIGDSEKDILAGQKARCRTVLVGEVSLPSSVIPDIKARDLPDAADKILKQKRGEK